MSFLSVSMLVSDPELWKQILADDRSAWVELVRRYQPLVYTVATRAGLSNSDAADCFQQTFVRLYQNRHKIQEPSRLSAWLVTTAKRESLRLINQNHRGAELVLQQSSPRPAALPDEELEQLERQAHLELALKKLDDRCRVLLTALFFSPEEMSYADIAKLTGISFNSLGPIRQRCLERLRRHLEENGFPIVRKTR